MKEIRAAENEIIAANGCLEGSNLSDSALQTEADILRKNAELLHNLSIGSMERGFLASLVRQETMLLISFELSGFGMEQS
ncbi:hypothetical protein BWQ96_04656 [Gracilariopsis chorda]|uniref:Uncharacterized protein n=1 Tax=Gracilariopsis chorda TaxID=448386 RepID=A0A2V3IU05_9FLOR|nr:hypothetical protein BWQ96_04656 [Gracilariopsis chorda]|eukprot:PXF45579.1 hypothetical protein BWQ96_04656 [Gracilariopsis chorda]